MKQFAIIIICLLVVLTSSQCEKETPNGHLKVTVTYPEAVVVPDQPTYFIQVPADGAEVRLYDKDARCGGYKDAQIDVAWIDGKPVGSEYAHRSNENGEVVFNDIPAGEYYLVVHARKLYKYSEKNIDVIGDDTLKLSKDFTPAAQFTNDLEPWDYVMPVN